MQPIRIDPPQLEQEEAYIFFIIQILYCDRIHSRAVSYINNYTMNQWLSLNIRHAKPHSIIFLFSDPHIHYLAYIKTSEWFQSSCMRWERRDKSHLVLGVSSYSWSLFPTCPNHTVIRTQYPVCRYSFRDSNHQHWERPLEYVFHNGEIHLGSWKDE